MSENEIYPNNKVTASYSHKCKISSCVTCLYYFCSVYFFTLTTNERSIFAWHINIKILLTWKISVTYFEEEVLRYKNKFMRKTGWSFDNICMFLYLFKCLSEYRPISLEYPYRENVLPFLFLSNFFVEDIQFLWNCV